MEIFASSDRTLDVLDVRRLARARVRAEWLYQRRQALADMQTRQSVHACLRLEVPADHETHSQAQQGQLRERVSRAREL